ncbi:MAG: transcription initiation protein [Mucilaginibacter sp.]|nr:transcription initiation protein [Mucilaginibacter sp.]
MKEFVLIFRNSNNPDFKPSPEQMQEVMTAWMNWMGSIAAQNKLAHSGNRLSVTNAKTVKPNNVITDGPYTEIKEFINGYIVVKTVNIDEAIDFAKECPILKVGGNVEVRAVVAPDDNS